ncbi:MAG TPA: tetratricopeptide repeat protein, partial [Terriglobales bacterium]|nr:tetratricopeptide repeat protein [Terriglobales bacterium]
DLQVAAALVSLELEDQQPQAAAAVYRSILRYYPGDLRIRNNIAMIQAQGGDFAGAIASLRQLLAEQPGYGSARVNLAQVLYRAGDRHAAIAELQRAQSAVAGTPLEAITRDQLAAWRGESSPQ